MSKNLKFIDLFAGIGGFHLALHRLGAQCVFASEIDKFARLTYEHNFKSISPKLFNGNYNDDILNISPSEIPDFDILCAGFPCQPFSQAGYKRGFGEDRQSRGNMFFVLRDIIREKRPAAIFLENVRHLKNHDNGRTFEIIKDIIENELEYDFYFKVVKASDHGLPQFRPRLFMVGFRKEDSYPNKFEFPKPVPLLTEMSDIWGGSCNRKIGFTLRVGGRSSGLDDRRNWDTYLVDGKVRTLGSDQGKKLMGYPDSFEFPVSKMQSMKQLGNSVAVNAVQATAKEIMLYLDTMNTTNLIGKNTNAQTLVHE